MASKNGMKQVKAILTDAEHRAFSVLAAGKGVGKREFLRLLVVAAIAGGKSPKTCQNCGGTGKVS
jgi:hypothetical protein